MVELTVGVSTFRWGGIDVLFNSLARQDFRDYELVLVDEHYEYRKEEVGEYADRLGIPLVHVPPKQKSGRVGISNGYNTFLVHARGELVLFLTDYEWVGRETLKRHVELHRRRRDAVTVGLVHKFASPKPADLRGPITVFGREMDSPPRKLLKWDDKLPRLCGVHRYRRAYVGDNSCFPLEAALRVNGFDERFDVSHGFEDTDFFARLRLLGCEVWCDTHNEVRHVDHSFFPVHEERPNPNEGLYRGKLERIRRGEEGLRAPNPFDLYKLRGGAAFERAVAGCGNRWFGHIMAGLLVSPRERNPAQLARLGWIAMNAEQPVLNVGCRDTDFGGVNLDVEPQDVPNFVLGDAHALPFGDRSFRTVILAELLEHVEDPRRVLGEAKRVGSKILVTVPWEARWARFYSPFRFHQHRRFYTMELLCHELERAGIGNYIVEPIELAGYAFLCAEAEVSR